MRITHPQARLLLLLGLVVGLAALSLRWSSEPHYDAWAWLGWGRQLVSARERLATAGGPAWKPLPVLVSALAAPAGSAAPALWLVVARAGGLLALVLAGLLAASAGRLAAVVAAAALAVSQDWWLAMSWGATEPLLVALLLGAALASRRDRPGVAEAALLAAALCRVEAWPFLLLHGVWCARQGVLRARVVAAGNLAVAFLWFAPDWYSTGDPLHGGRAAMLSREALTTPHDLPGAIATVASRAWHVLPSPVWALAAIGLMWAWRAKCRWALALAAGALAWDALVVALTVRGFAGLGRFTVPAAAGACVLAGLGASAAAGGVLALLPSPCGARAVAAAAAAAAAITIPAWLSVVGNEADAALDSSGDAAFSALRSGVSRVRSLHGLGPRYAVRVNGPLGTALAWLMRAPIEAVNGRDGHARRWVIYQVPRGPFAGPVRRVPRGAVCRTVRADTITVVLVARTPTVCRAWVAARTTH